MQMTLNEVQIFLKNNLSYKWAFRGTVIARGIAFNEDNILDSDGIADFFIDKKSCIDIVDGLKSLDGFFNIICACENGVVAVVDQIRSMPLLLKYDNQGGVIIEDSLELSELSQLDINDNELKTFRHSLFTTNNNTLFSTVTQISAGELAVVNRNYFKIIQYFDYEYNKNNDVGQEKIIQELNCEFDAITDRVIRFLNGRAAIIPLSGGHDSRLLVFYLKKHGYNNIITYTYGIKGNLESDYSRKVAECFGVKWFFVEYKQKEMKKLFKDSFAEFGMMAFGGVSVPCLQEWYAIYYLLSNELIPEDGIVIPGYSGDFMAGSHLVNNLEKGYYTRNEVANFILKRYFAEEDDRFTLNSEYILDSINLFLPESDTYSSEQFNEIIERFDWKNRQAKYIENATRVYGFFGLHWITPYFFKSHFLLWGSVQNDYRMNRKAFFQLEESIYNDKIKDIGYYKGRRVDGFLSKMIDRIKVLLVGPSYLHFMYGYYDLRIDFYKWIFTRKIRNIDQYAKESLLKLLGVENDNCLHK